MSAPDGDWVLLSAVGNNVKEAGSCMPWQGCAVRNAEAVGVTWVRAWNMVGKQFTRI